MKLYLEEAAPHRGPRRGSGSRQNCLQQSHARRVLVVHSFIGADGALHTWRMRGFCFSRNIAFLFAPFPDTCPLGMCEQARRPSAFMLTPWPPGKACGTLGVHRGPLRTAGSKPRSEPWERARSSLSAGRCDRPTPLFPSRWVVAAAAKHPCGRPSTEALLSPRSGPPKRGSPLEGGSGGPCVSQGSPRPDFRERTLASGQLYTVYPHTHWESLPHLLLPHL